MNDRHDNYSDHNNYKYCCVGLYGYQFAFSGQGVLYFRTAPVSLPGGRAHDSCSGVMQPPWCLPGEAGRR